MSRRSSRIKVVVLLLLIGAAIFAVFYQADERPDVKDLVKTGSSSLRPGAGIFERWKFQWHNFWAKRKPQPRAYTMLPHPVTLCSIHGMLNQVSEMSGVTYFVDREVVAGTIKLGNATPVTGEKWIAMVEKALMSGNPDWGMHHGNDQGENLILIRYPRQKIVIVVPRAKAAGFERSTTIRQGNEWLNN